MAFEALIAEYSGVRASSLSRDQNINTLSHLTLLVVCGSFAAIPTMSRGFACGLLVVSLVLSVLSFSILKQHYLLRELAIYENDILAPRLHAILRAMSDTLPEAVTDLWCWQAYLESRQKHGSTSIRMFRRIPIGMIELGIFGAWAGVIAFLQYRTVTGLTWIEYGLLGSTSLAAIAASVGYLLFRWAVPRQLMPYHRTFEAVVKKG